MKILIVVPNTSVANGITTAANSFSNEMIKRGHEIDFLDMSGKAQNFHNLHPKVSFAYLKGKSRLWNIGVQELKQAQGVKKLLLFVLGAIKKSTISFGLWYRLIFSKFMAKECYDIAIAFRQCAPCYSFVLNKVKAKKKIGFVHGELSHMDVVSSWDKYLKRFDRIACVSHAVKDQFVDRYSDISDKFVTVYNMLDVERIEQQSKEASSIEINRNIVNIATVARIDNQFKQIDWIISICERLKKHTGIKFKWYIIGNGRDYDNMVNLAKQKHVDDVLVFTGSQTNPHAIVRHCDFTVLTSKSEAYGMVVVESIILKKPVIVTKYPAIYEIITDGKEGMIVEQSVEAVCESVLKLIENKDNLLTILTENLSKNQFTNEVAYNQFMNSIS